MKRPLYFLLVLLLLLGAFSGYQYLQYGQQLDALKTATNNKTSSGLPVDTVAVALPPNEAYYTHHQQLSSIASNPLFSATIQRKLHFYDYSQNNDALLDFLNLLNYRERLLAQAEPEAQAAVEQQMQQYREQLCSRWEAFAKHVQQAYPDRPEAEGLSKLCAASAISDYKPADVTSWLSDPVVK